MATVEKITARIPTDLVRKLRLESLRSHRDMKAIIEDALSAYLPTRIDLVVKGEKQRAA